VTWRRAVVVGANGGIGAALAGLLESGGSEVLRFSRSGGEGGHIDIEDEASIAAAAAHASKGGPVDLVLVATGVLAIEGYLPEKTWRALDADRLARSYAVNAIGPVLVAKHFLPLLPRKGAAAFAVLGARVGSIGDNALGGWYGYRASKAALAMMVRTLSIELARSRPDAVCVALHPGTVDTPLSEPFQGNVAHDKLFTPRQSAERLLAVLDSLTPADSGGHFAWDGSRIDP
jgi:NAD(P)-dependent dehydrogenase (short-subunit alcohol dehydrogenase family)